MNFVRLATVDDAMPIAVLQCDTWRYDYPELFQGSAGKDLEPAFVAERWRPVLQKDIPGFVLVATSGDRVVGFAAADVRDDTAEVHTLIVAPHARRAGHGSRLMSACADLVQRDGAREALMWCIAEDQALAEFLRSAGWAPDGGSRELSDDHALIREVRFVTTFAEQSKS
jgi:GNAT superfamily N-acetyltransferase